MTIQALPVQSVAVADAASSESASQSDIVSVPNHWQLVKLGDIARGFISGGTPSTKSAELWSGTIPWTTSAAISESDVLLSHAQRFISERGVNKSASNIVPKNNLLVGTRVGVGKAVVNTIDVAISQDLTGVIIDEKEALPLFIAYQLKVERVQSYFDNYKRGTTIKGISRFDLQNIVLRLPSLPEQCAIIDFLHTVQRATQSRCREVVLERERKAVLIEYLFTHGASDQSPIWIETTLGEVITLQRGFDLPARERKLGHVPIVSSSGITGTHSEAKVQGPGVVTGRYGTIGQVFYVEEDFWPLNTTLYVRDFKGNDPLFTSYLLRTLDFESRNDKTSVPGVNRNHLHMIGVRLPPLPEQREIASILNACDRYIASLDREISLLEELFRVLLEELMADRLSSVPLIAVEET